MDGMTDERIHRVTVRGRFVGLTDQARQYLVRAQPEHDIFVSAFTPEGTFTYDERIAFFNLRYEVRSGGERAAADAGDTAVLEAEQFLSTMGFGHGPLKADVVDATAIWDDVERRRAR